MRIAVLGPGGVGGLLAAALQRAGTETIVVARPETARLIAERGLQVDSVLLGRWHARPAAVERLPEPVDALIVATKSTGLQASLERIEQRPRLVLPLLNGLDHVVALRQRFPASDAQPDPVLAGAIRVEADRTEPGVIAHTSPFVRIDMAADDPGRGQDMRDLVAVLADAGIPAQILDSEAQVMWAKLARLNALACTTSAFDLLLGPIRDTPELRRELEGAVREGTEVAQAEGAHVTFTTVMAELEDAHATLGTSMQRDIAAGRPTEFDAIPGAVLRAAQRHGIACPTIERLVALIVKRTGLPAPTVPA